MKLPGSFDLWGDGWVARRALLADTGEGDAGAGGGNGAAAGGGAAGAGEGAAPAGEGAPGQGDQGEGAAPGGGDTGAAAGAKPEWWGALSDKNRKLAEGQGLDTPDKVLEQYRKLSDRNRIEVPGEDADQETKDKFYNALGRPETPDGYSLEPPKDMPEGIIWSDAGVQAALPILHAAGLSQEQASACVPAMIAVRQAEIEARNAQRADQAKETLAALQNGPDAEVWQGEGFEKNVAAIMEMLSGHPLGGQFLATMEETGWGNYPELVAVFHDFRVATSEDSMTGIGQGGGGAGQETAETLTTKMEEIEHTEAFKDRNHAGHKQARKQWRDLQEQKFALVESGKEDVDSVVATSGSARAEV